MFDDVVEIASKTYDRNDKAQLTINHSGMKSELFVHLQDLSNLNGANIMSRFDKVLNSDDSLSVDNSFEISIGLMKTTKGGGQHRLPLYPHLNNSLYSSVIRKRSIVEIVPIENEFLCAAMSVIVCLGKLDKMTRGKFKSLIDKRRQCQQTPASLRSQAKALHTRANLPYDRKVTIDKLTNFEEVLNVKIVVVQFAGSVPMLTECSQRKCDKVIFLYLADDHFHSVVNPDALFQKHIICFNCLELFKSSEYKTHPCLALSCFVCKRKECLFENTVVCNDCNLSCRSDACFQRHKEKSLKGQALSLCEKRYKCQDCGKVAYVKAQAKEDHVCGQYKCRNCDDFVDLDHLCYHRRRKVKDNSGKFLFFDFETMQDEAFQCDEGYSPSENSVDCTSCSENIKCIKCKTCTNCKSSKCGRPIHVPNLVVSQSVCNMCKDQELLPGSTCRSCGSLCDECVGERGDQTENDSCCIDNCGARENVFKGDNTVTDFCNWLISPKFKSFTCIAHNGKGYDFNFILNFCVSEAGIKPDIIYAGSKIMSMKIPSPINLTFIDSLNFMAMPLKKLPKAFDLRQEGQIDGESMAELSKGTFPHKLNRKDLIGTVSAWPDISMYGVDSMSPEERDAFTSWHSKQRDKVFDLDKEMLAYCKLDVSILRLACMKFRDLFLKITTITGVDGEKLGYVDPFSHVTIASACMQIFRVNFISEYYDIEMCDGRVGEAKFQSGQWHFEDEQISENEIKTKKFQWSNLSQIPAQGYIRTSNHSEISIAWLEWESKKRGKQIQHARNLGEKVIYISGRKYVLDGWIEGDENIAPTVLEFHGCRFHGHDKCMKDKTLRDPRSGFTMDDLKRLTEKRANEIRKAGYKLIEIYECDFHEQIKKNPELAQFVKCLDIPKRMKPRDSFFGGRVSVFSMYKECRGNEEIHYNDVCSMYPFVTKHMRQPLKHCDIITKDFDMTLKSYFGVAHVKLLPPKDLYVPCIPVRHGGKLTFPLCRTCMTEERQSDCGHSDEERMITGAWCTPEIMAAISRNYKVIKVYEVYNYKHSTKYDVNTRDGGIFAEQVDMFLKIKTEATGFPEWVSSEGDKEKYALEFEQKVGVKLDVSQIQNNPALRSIAKICLNSFWGKLGERNNKTQCKYISSTLELEKIKSKSEICMRMLHIINEDVLVVEYNRADDFEQDSGTTNEIIASLTTCYARLELLRHMDTVGKRILYCDTDSLIFATNRIKDGEGPECYDIYPKLGDNHLGELTNELKPRTFITHFASIAPKSYSYRCNDGTETCKFKGITLNYLNSQKINFDSLKDLLLGNKQTISLVPQVQFVREKFNGQIFNMDLVKTARATFNKRRILENFDTVPFGFVCPLDD